MTDIDRALSLLDGDEVVQLTRNMVAIPSITHREGREMTVFMAKWFDDLGIPVRYLEKSGGRAHLFAEYGASGGPGRFLFNGHQDTKPVDGMTVDPFAGEIRDGRMYGRGACDMKGGLAAFMCAFKALVRAGIAPKTGLTLYSDIEEEYSGEDGFLPLATAGMFDEYAGLICGEPSELQVHIGNTGAIATAFECRGRRAHASIPEHGVNAIHGAARFITEFMKLPYLTLENPYFGRATLNFEKIDGGFDDATVPDHCTICLDSRLIPETPPETVYEQANALIARLMADGVEIHEVMPPSTWRPKQGANAAAWIEPEHPLAQAVIEAVGRGTGKEAVIAALPGATFAGVLIRRGIPAIILGPGSIRQAHTEDEWVEVAQIPAAARIFTALMAGLALDPGQALP